MAGDLPPVVSTADRTERGRLASTPLVRDRTTRVEATARRRRGGIGGLARQAGSREPHVGIGYGHGGEQCLSVGVERFVVERGHGGDLDHPPEVHDGDSIRHLTHDGEIVG